MKRRPLRLIGRLAVAVVIVLLYVTGTSFMGKQFWLFDLGTHFRAQWVVLAALAGMVLSYKRAVGWAVLAVALLVANLVPLLPSLSPAEGLTAAGSTVSVISVNVSASNSDFEAVLDYLADRDADLVFLHESNREWERAIGRAELGYRVWVTRPPGFVFGTAVLTKEGMEVDALRLGAARRASAQVRLSIDGAEVWVLGTHTLSPTDGVRTVLRDDQFEQIGLWAQTAPVPVAVFGDFNSAPWSYGLDPLRDAGLRDSMAGHGLQRSWPSWTWAWPFRIPIDNAFVSSGLAVVERRLGPHVGSDHFPLEVEVGINATP